jgi:hypothetical protein
MYSSKPYCMKIFRAAVFHASKMMVFLGEMIVVNRSRLEHRS